LNVQRENRPHHLAQSVAGVQPFFYYARDGPRCGADGLLIRPPVTPVMGGFAGPDTNSGIGDLCQARSRLGLSNILKIR